MLTALYVVALGSLLVSFSTDRQRNAKAVKIAWKKFSKILPKYLMLLILISVVLLISEDLIARFLVNSPTSIALLFSLLVGSITMMPGFIAYPLAGLLVSKGVSYMAIAGFLTSLMMVGIVTYPVERQYLGTRATLLRNGVSVVIALVIALATGIIYGEL